MSHLSKYINWNEALIDYFVTNGSTVWYVTDSVIESIGQKYGIVKDENTSYTDDFINCLFLICAGGAVSNETYRNWFVPVNREIWVLGGENESCTEENLNAFGEITIEDVYRYYKCRNLNDLQNRVDVDSRHFEQIIQACIADYEECSLFRPLYRLSENCKDNIRQEELRDMSFIDFALFLANNNFFYDDVYSPKQLNFPYFPFLILVLLGFNRSDEQTWDQVEALFQNKGVPFPANERPKVAELFQIAIRDGLLNENCTRTPDCYVKYLKYHSVLTPGRRNVFERVLYDHNISFEEGLHFNDVRNWIWRAAPLADRRQFERELLNNENRHYFETVIRSFDREIYRERLNSQIENNGQTEKSRGLFCFVVDTETSSCSVWTEKICVAKSLKNEKLEITPKYIIPDHYVVDVPDLCWRNYVDGELKYDDDSFVVETLTGRDCRYFEINNERWLVEVSEPGRLVGRQCFFAIRDNNETLINRHQATECVSPIVRFFLPDDWKLYYTSFYAMETIEGNAEIVSSLNTQTAFARVVVEDALRVNNGVKLSYLAEAFPYIKFEGVEYSDVDIKILDSVSRTLVNFKKKNIKDRIYLYNFGPVQSGEIILEIYDSKNNRIDYNIEAKSHFTICRAGEILSNNSKEYVKFDKWFCVTTNKDSYFSNNRVYPLQESDIRWEPSTDKPSAKTNVTYSNLMAVLYAMGETRQHNGFKTINDTTLDTALMYEAEFRGLSLSKSQLKRLKHTLCEMGVLTHYYDGGHYYQTNAVCLMPTGNRYVENALIAGDRGYCFYILGGAYSKKDYDKAINGAKYVEYVEQQDPLFKILPPMVKVGYEIGTTLPLEENKYGTYQQLLNFAGSISDFEKDSVFTQNTIASHDGSTYDTPCMVPSMDSRGRREQLRIDNERILSNHAISLSLLRNYANFKHNKYVWIQRGNGDIYFKDERDIPYYAKRSLTSFSACIAKSVFVFGVDNVIGNGENSLFERLTTYSIPKAETRKRTLELLLNMLGDTSTPELKVNVPNDDKKKKLCLYAFKKEECGTNKWWIELSCKDKVVCYTDPDSYPRDVYCIYEANYQKIIKTEQKGRDKSLNELLSAVIKVYDEQYYFTNIQQFYKDKGICLDMSSTKKECPSQQQNYNEKQEVTLMIKAL